MHRKNVPLELKFAQSKNIQIEKIITPEEKQKIHFFLFRKATNKLKTSLK